MHVCYYVHAGKAIVSALCFLLLLFVCICFGASGAWIPCVISMLLSILFLAILFTYGARVHMNETGIRCRQFPFQKKEFQWQDLQEVGILGTHVFGSERAKHRGEKFIYFSPSKYTEDDRFRMCLKWPPKDIIYMQYKQPRIQAVKKHWSEEVLLYNIGEHFAEDNEI